MDWRGCGVLLDQVCLNLLACCSCISGESALKCSLPLTAAACEHMEDLAPGHRHDSDKGGGPPELKSLSPKGCLPPQNGWVGSKLRGGPSVGCWTVGRSCPCCFSLCLPAARRRSRERICPALPLGSSASSSRSLQPQAMLLPGVPSLCHGQGKGRAH